MTAPAALASTLTTLDITIFIITLAVSVLIGLYFANKNESVSEYMLGGNEQKIIPVSMSMMTSFVSGLTLIGSPVELYHHGILYSMLILAILLCVPFTCFIFLPVFYRLKCTSVLEYLERRFSLNLRLFMSVVFIFQMALYNAVVLYIPSLSLQEILGISEKISIGAVGVSCIIYSTVGGIKAVIWTDFFQSALMYLSLLSICVGGTIEAGGISKLLEVNYEGGRLSFEPFFNLDLSTRHTVLTVLVGGTIVKIFLNGVNQVQVQRALSLPTLRQAQWSQLISALFTVIIFVIASYVGLIMYSSYRHCDPFDNQEIEKRDALVIYYISTHLTNFVGLRGLFVAGVFAATLSTLSSFQNSMSALVMEDFLKPHLEKRGLASDKMQLHLSKALALFFGVLCLALTFVVGQFTGLLQVANLLLGALGAPFVAAFVMGMLTRFTNSVGMTTGFLCGAAFGLYVQIYQTFYLPPLQPTLDLSTEGCPSAMGHNASALNLARGQASEQRLLAAGATNILHMSYFWLPTFSLAISMLVAAVVSLLTGGRRQQVSDKYLVAWLHEEADLSCKG